MDQIRIGSFLKELRKERKMTQEDLAEKLNVSGRTVSRWETGSNMPDIGMLVEIAEFYEVSIPEIIIGERKSEKMNQEVKETAAAMAEYSQNEVINGIQKVTGILLLIFGFFIIVTALMSFPSESSWGSNYSIIGGVILLAGLWYVIHPLVRKRSHRAMIIAGCAFFLAAAFEVSDYIAIEHFHQVPRFRLTAEWSSEFPDQVVYKKLFYSVVRKNPGSEKEEVYILK